MSKIHEVSSIYEKLKTEWNRKPPNVDKISELLRLLKVNIFIVCYLEILLVLRIILPKVDFIHRIQMKIHVV